MNRGASRLLHVVWRATFAVLLFAATALGHEVRPSYLELKETEPGRFAVLFRRPIVAGAALRLDPIFPAGWRALGPRQGETAEGAQVDHWEIESGPAGSTSGDIAIDGLRATTADVLVRIERRDRPVQSALLRPDTPSMSLAGEDVSLAGYVRLGVEHILYGIDHLLFVLALLLLTKGTWRVVKTITAFTIAHSVTLATAALGFVRVPVAPVEAVIALSIVFVASEIVRSQRDPGAAANVAQRSPWIVAFSFGLLHGFGFAGTLGKLGLPPSEIPSALLLFNVGVELGQLGVVLVYLAFVGSLATLSVAWPKWSRPLPAYAVGSAAAFMLLQRVVVILEGA